ncbi:Na+/H+ antiporter subunit E [Mycolicibacterium thermoresistibile]
MRATRTWAASAALRLLGFAAVWWALTEGDPGMWTYGVVAVPLTVAVSLQLLPPRRSTVGVVERAVAIVSLGVWFLGQSFQGGLDVARRAVRRPVDVDPGMFEYRTQLESLVGRVMVAAISTLIPGTLAVDLDDDVIHVHALDMSMPNADQLADLERRIARVVGKTLP